MIVTHRAVGLSSDVRRVPTLRQLPICEKTDSLLYQLPILDPLPDMDKNVAGTYVTVHHSLIVGALMS